MTTALAPVKNGKQSEIERDTRGRFVTGNKGGPGRPPVEFSPRQIIRTQLEQRPSVIAKLFDLAEEGDLTAILAIIHYVEPPVKGDSAPVVVNTQVNVSW